MPAQLDAVAEAAVAQYLDCARANPIMLVHAATAPAAAGAALASLPKELWRLTFKGAWSLSAALTSCYAVAGPDKGELVASLSSEEVFDRAVDNGDEHVIKFTDVAVAAHDRGCVAALSAAMLAVSLITE